jgi:DNA-binding transcriptional ArsR family regulator
MSDKRLSKLAEMKTRAAVFAALGDETRLAVVAKLLGGEAQSISRLTDGLKLTRQGVTKHLKVLEDAGIVHGVRVGRETLFKLEAQPIEDARAYLERVAQQWDDALARLKAFAEE